MSDAAGDAAGDAWQAIIGALCTAGAALAGDAGLADVDVAEGLRYVLTVLGDQVEPAALRGSDHAIFPPRDHARQQAVLRQPRRRLLRHGARLRRPHLPHHRSTGHGTLLAVCVYSGSPGITVTDRG